MGTREFPQGSLAWRAYATQRSNQPLCIDPATAMSCEAMFQRALSAAEAAGLRLSDQGGTLRQGCLYRPTGPCRYGRYGSGNVLHDTVAEFVSRELCSDPVYRSNPNNHDRVVRYLRANLPRLVTDGDVVAFDNGVLLLGHDGAPSRFVSFSEARDKVARHTIAGRLDVHAPQATPLWDAVVLRQLTEDRARELHAMIGRLLHGATDRFVWLHGPPASGKSVVLRVVDAMFEKTVEGRARVLYDLPGTGWGRWCDLTRPMICASASQPRGRHACVFERFVFGTTVPPDVRCPNMYDRIIREELPSVVFKCVTACA